MREEHTATYLHYLLLVLRQKPLGGVFRETSLDHLLNTQSLHSEQVQNHVVREPEL